MKPTIKQDLSVESALAGEAGVQRRAGIIAAHQEQRRPISYFSQQVFLFDRLFFRVVPPLLQQVQRTSPD
ncbi:hypothetical protein [uncultured Nevskia sp.]|uniref:hypothetical protein n=1 Tax=uncultured Nevskia sp. TaxID=228950 RepID=UPI0025EDFBB4|nr:hypothetical protein [uncultured Nevskia sp.]